MYDPQTDTINSNAAYQYIGIGAEGANFLLFHETGHDLPNGLASSANTSASFYARGGVQSDWPKSPEWIANERVANDNAQTMSNVTSEPIENPTGTPY
jgi:hypothetical protein